MLSKIENHAYVTSNLNWKEIFAELSFFGKKFEDEGNIEALRCVQDIHQELINVNGEVKSPAPTEEQPLTLTDSIIGKLVSLRTLINSYELPKNNYHLFTTFHQGMALASGLTTLPNDLKIHVFHLLDGEKDKKSILLTNWGNYRLFRPEILLDNLLQATVHGDQNKVEQIIKQSPKLLLSRRKVTDYSGRTFFNITAFEYALWALDVKYMCPAMIHCLPKNEEGEIIRKNLLQQYEMHKIHGVKYNLNGVEYIEKHFDFSCLITALTTYIANHANWAPDNCVAHWCKVVGLAQSMLPAHVAQHYCDRETSFYPTPDFKKDKLIRCLNFRNFLTLKDEFWFSPPINDKGLGVTFGIGGSGVRGGNSRPMLGRLGNKVPKADLIAIEKLIAVRIKDYELLELFLQNSLLSDVTMQPGKG